MHEIERSAHGAATTPKSVRFHIVYRTKLGDVSRPDVSMRWFGRVPFRGLGSNGAWIMTDVSSPRSAWLEFERLTYGQEKPLSPQYVVKYLVTATKHLHIMGCRRCSTGSHRTFGAFT